MLTSFKAWKDDEELEVVGLTAKDYYNLYQQLDKDRAIEINHLETIDINIEGIQGKWERYDDY